MPTGSSHFVSSRLRCRRSTTAEPGAIAYLHASPPCQALSPRNRFRSYPRLQRELVPMLEQASSDGRALMCCTCKHACVESIGACCWR